VNKYFHNVGPLFSSRCHKALAIRISCSNSKGTSDISTMKQTILSYEPFSLQFFQVSGGPCAGFTVDSWCYFVCGRWKPSSVRLQEAYADGCQTRCLRTVNALISPGYLHLPSPTSWTKGLRLLLASSKSTLRMFPVGRLY
jgi:hypothetical protein